MAATIASSQCSAQTAFCSSSANTEKDSADQALNLAPVGIKPQMDPSAFPFQPGEAQSLRDAPFVPLQYGNPPQRTYDNYLSQLQHQAALPRWPQDCTYQSHQPGLYPAYPMYSAPNGQFYYNAPPALQFHQHPQQTYPSHTFITPVPPAPTCLFDRGPKEGLQQAPGASTQNAKPKSKSKSKKRKSKTPNAQEHNEMQAAAGDCADQSEYGFFRHYNSSQVARVAINKTYRISKAPKAQQQASQRQGRYGNHKIMLPAPQPTQAYLRQAAEEPLAVVGRPGHILVILDLNGTLLCRPNANPKTMIERPFLNSFLPFLFENFSVMIWSSAKPENVRSLVTQSIDKNLQSGLVATWARDSFGLSPANYNQNVQVYKNLKLIWSRDVIQQHHPGYAVGQRFGQHNTVLIDDSSIKASAQPYNLLEIPEFKPNAKQLEDNVLHEVAGYLEELKWQRDVSMFIHKKPFRTGQWNFQLPHEVRRSNRIKGKLPGQENVDKGVVVSGLSVNKDDAMLALSTETVQGQVPVLHQ